MKRSRKYLFIGIVLLVLLMMGFDYSLALHGKPPVFAIRTLTYKDGGTKIYMGLGYKVIDYNELEGRKDVVFRFFYLPEK